MYLKKKNPNITNVVTISIKKKEKVFVVIEHSHQMLLRNKRYLARYQANLRSPPLEPGIKWVLNAGREVGQILEVCFITE